MEGWIKLHRSIKKHWIFQDSEYLKYWLYLLLDVNHETKKVIWNKELIEIKRGQKITSLQKLAKEFNCSREKVRRFLDLLKNDSMINIESNTRYTQITICNYDSYQTIEHTKKTRKKHEKNTDETRTDTNKNDKNDKNEKNNLSKFDLTFIEFEKMRSKIKKPLTEKAKELILLKLEDLSNDENVKIKILEQSIENSWQGVFPLKNNIQTPKMVY